MQRDTEALRRLVRQPTDQRVEELKRRIEALQQETALSDGADPNRVANLAAALRRRLAQS